MNVPSPWSRLPKGQPVETVWPTTRRAFPSRPHVRRLFLFIVREFLKHRRKAFELHPPPSDSGDAAIGVDHKSDRRRVHTVKTRNAIPRIMSHSIGDLPLFDKLSRGTFFVPAYIDAQKVDAPVFELLVGLDENGRLPLATRSPGVPEVENQHMAVEVFQLNLFS